MGRFNANIQMKTAGETREQFVARIEKAMEQRGLVPCTEEDAGQSYLLVFSEGNAWATICAEQYESGGHPVRQDVRFLSQALQTICFSVSVVDSDFAILELCDQSGSAVDTVIVGDGSGYGFEDQTKYCGKETLWKPLLTEPDAWNQFSALCREDAVFVEDSLAKMAPFLGLEGSQFTVAYDALNDMEGKEVTALHFKAMASPKKCTVNTAFKQVFGEALAPLGFQLAKGRHPYLVRVVPGGEILHVITFRNESIGAPGYKAMDLLAGVATVYRPQIDLSVSPMTNLAWLNKLSRFCIKRFPDIDFTNRQYWQMIQRFPYKADDSELLVDTLKYIFELTEKYVLPELQKVSDLQACLTYLGQYKMDYGIESDLDYKNSNGVHHWNEGLWRIKLERQELKEHWEKVPNEENIEEEMVKQIKDSYALVNDPQSYEKVLIELERRKTENTARLQSYGIDITAD